MYCNECGAQIPEGSIFCSVCGAEINVPQAQSDNSIPQAYTMSQMNNAQQAYFAPQANSIQQNYAEPQANVQQGSDINIDNETNNKKKGKLPIWAKIWIVVCILAVVGLATFLTIHFVKGKKSGKGDASVTINGTKCEFNSEDGISNINKAQDGIVYRRRNGVEIDDEVYINGVLSPDADSENYDIVIEKDPVNFSGSNVKLGCLAISLYNFPNFKMGDGTNWGSSIKELEKAGYVYDGMCLYSKFYDKDGEIPLDRINSDYDKFLTGGYDALDYSLGTSFPDVIRLADLRGNREENRKALIEQFEKMGYSSDDWDKSIKSLMLFSSEAAKLSGMRKSADGAVEYVGSTSEYLVRVDYFYYGGKYNFTVIRIYAPIEKLNTYLEKWELPETVLYNLNSSGESTEEVSTEDNTTEFSEAQTEATTGEQVAEQVEITVADIPEYEALEEFFYQFDTYSDNNGTDNYDSQTATDGNSNIVESIIGNPSCVMDQGRYDAFDFESSWGESIDPRGYMEDENSKWYMMGYHSVSTYGLKWVAENIFNVSEADFVTLNNQMVNDDTCYIENDRYYYMVGGIGWLSYDFNIHSVKTDGKYYYIVYSMDMDPEMFGEDYVEEYPAAVCEAKMELKNIDGKNYWSMYYNYVIEPIKFYD